MSTQAVEYELKLARRMSRLGTETAFEVLARAKALERQGRSIVHLEIGEPDFATPPNIVEAAVDALRGGYTHYGPSAGLPELRETIARIGGGRVAPVTAQFEAMASTRLPGGELLSLGPVTAEWNSIPYDAEAKRTEDEKFAGHFDQRGRFLPAAAGPNPAREFTGDNVGNLTVVAQARDGDRAVEGRSHLIVTVQRWNTPPIY